MPPRRRRRGRGKPGRPGTPKQRGYPRPPDHGGTCAVIMAAWRAKAPWMEQAIESIEKQKEREGWTYELRIGVDGCEETSRFLLRSGRAHWYSPENVGPYVMRNSLIELEEAEAYAPFDCDDIMRPHYLHELLGWVGRDGIAGSGRTTINSNGRLVRRRSRFQHGICVISHNAWTKLGGYRAWPMAADHDLILRAGKLRIRVKVSKRALYKRRKHRGSLTQRPETGLQSKIRGEFRDRAKNLTKRGIGLQVSPKTTELEWREP